MEPPDGNSMEPSSGNGIEPSGGTRIEVGTSLDGDANGPSDKNDGVGD
jgi:hypothetical protein